MKKTYVCLVVIALVLSVLLSSCGEFSPAVPTPGGNGTATESESVTSPGEGEEREGVFTVTLSYDGEVYIPSGSTPIFVQWSDGYSVHKAEIGADGKATMEGLDGDYRVTLSAVPDGYAYNPTAYTATNDHPDTVIELHKLISTEGKGSDVYSDPIHIRSTGLYAVTIDQNTRGEAKEIFFRFSPTKSGTYSVVSWMDTVANEINPIANYYGANVSFMQNPPTVYDGGGAEGAYTKNFAFDVEIADEMISTGGQVAFSFGVTATAKSGIYPVTVYFAVMLDGEFSLNFKEAPIIVPQELENWSIDIAGCEYVYAETVKTVDGVTGKIFDGSRYQYWSKDAGGDGFYHVYDPEAYPTTGGYGPVLYADISNPCRFLGQADAPTAFTMVEYAGNKALTLSNGTENYKLFIEGYAKLSVDPNPNDNPGDSEPYFCTSNCPCRLSGTCESLTIAGVDGSCTEACTKCSPDCRRCPAEAMGKAGYGSIYGRAPVTKELQEFLQKYSISQRLFFDGNGWAETHPNGGIYAAEEDQWLFACGYYVKK